MAGTNGLSCRQSKRSRTRAKTEHADGLVQLVELELAAEIGDQPDHGEANAKQAEHEHGHQPVQCLGGPTPDWSLC